MVSKSRVGRVFHVGDVVLHVDWPGGWRVIAARLPDLLAEGAAIEPEILIESEIPLTKRTQKCTRMWVPARELRRDVSSRAPLKRASSMVVATAAPHASKSVRPRGSAGPLMTVANERVVHGPDRRQETFCECWWFEGPTLKKRMIRTDDLEVVASIPSTSIA